MSDLPSYKETQAQVQILTELKKRLPKRLIWQENLAMDAGYNKAIGKMQKAVRELMNELPSMTRTKVARYAKRKLTDFQPRYGCRIHPTNWWHEVGCTHRKWTIEELQRALDNAKKSNAYLSHIAFGTTVF